MKTLYAQIRDLLNTLDFNALNQGFKPTPFALYDQNHYCLNHEIGPKPNAFRGNTAMEFNGEHLAIWSLDILPDIPIEETTSGIVHEMFHVHQLTHNQTDYPNDFLILTQDLTEAYLYQLYNECQLLTQFQENLSTLEKHTLLAQILNSRHKRQELNPQLFGQELNLENFEGIAEFVGFKALKALAPQKANLKYDSYVKDLKESKCLIDFRNLCYSKGVLFLSLLESIGLKFENIAQTQKPNYHHQALSLLKDDIQEENTTPDPASWNLVKEIRDKRLIENQKAHDGFFETHPKVHRVNGNICGYDPINMIKVGNHILCKHFIAFHNGVEMTSLQGPLVIETDPDNIMKIKGYWK